MGAQAVWGQIDHDKQLLGEQIPQIVLASRGEMGSVCTACTMAWQAQEVVDDIRDGDYVEAAGEAAAMVATQKGYTKTAMCIMCCVDDDKDDGKPEGEA